MRIDISKLTRVLFKVARGFKKVAPELAIGAGTVGLVAAAVVACKRTPKALEVIEAHNDAVEIFDKALEDGKTRTGAEYTSDDYKADMALIYKQDALKMVKVYAPAVTIAIVSIGLIFTGGRMFHKRIASVTAAYAILDKAFSNYRDGVIEKFGAEVDKELRYKLSDTVIETPDEQYETVKETAYDGYSDYARIFDETNPNYQKDGVFNLNFLTKTQEYATKRLRMKGYLFLNEVYDMLGMPRSPIGQLAGWVYDPNDETIDNYVDFGLTDVFIHRTTMKDVMTNVERSFLLDFNCDGRILEKFQKYEKIPY